MQLQAKDFEKNSLDASEDLKRLNRQVNCRMNQRAICFFFKEEQVDERLTKGCIFVRPVRVNDGLFILYSLLKKTKNFTLLPVT